MVLLSDFDYHLPEELIAQTPLEQRDASRLLHMHRTSGEIEHRNFAEVVNILEHGDVLVLNNTRVNAWRFRGQKPTGGEVEILALKETEPAVYEAMLKPAKRLHPGSVIKISDLLSVEILEKNDNAIQLVKFFSHSQPLSPDDIRIEMARVGAVPLPPYITQLLEDPERYQTVSAKHKGSAAAPTAGLHFTQEILSTLTAKGIQIAEITLHVGIDTFRPIQVDDVSNHVMHGEVCEITPEAAQTINQAKGRIIAVGTTAVRTLETFASGVRKVNSGRTESRLFIHPGFTFQIIDGMFTNFHLPKTTMMLMISALSTREHILNAYESAVSERYRFLSFGDSMLILD